MTSGHCLVAKATFNFEKGLFQMTSKPLKQGTKFALVRAIQSSYNYGGLPLGRKLVLTYNGKMVKLHFYALATKNGKCIMLYCPNF